MSRIALLSTVLSCLMVTTVHGEPQDMPTKKAKERADALQLNPKASNCALTTTAHKTSRSTT